jgi:hypothetical protein
MIKDAAAPAEELRGLQSSDGNGVGHCTSCVAVVKLRAHVVVATIPSLHNDTACGRRLMIPAGQRSIDLYRIQSVHGKRHPGLLVLSRCPHPPLSHRDDGPLPITRCCRRAPPPCPDKSQSYSSLLFISAASREPSLSQRSPGATSTGAADVFQAFVARRGPPRPLGTTHNEAAGSAAQFDATRADQNDLRGAREDETTRLRTDRESQAPSAEPSSGRDRGSTPAVPPVVASRTHRPALVAETVRQHRLLEHQPTTVHSIRHLAAAAATRGHLRIVRSGFLTLLNSI